MGSKRQRTATGARKLSFDSSEESVTIESSSADDVNLDEPHWDDPAPVTKEPRKFKQHRLKKTKFVFHSNLLVPQPNISDRFRFPICVKSGIFITHVLISAILMALGLLKPVPIGIITPTRNVNVGFNCRSALAQSLAFSGYVMVANFRQYRKFSKKLRDFRILNPSAEGRLKLYRVDDLVIRSKRPHVHHLASLVRGFCAAIRLISRVRNDSEFWGLGEGIYI